MPLRSLILFCLTVCCLLPAVTLEAELPMGLYTVLVSTFQPDLLTNWDLKVFVKGDTKVQLEEAPPLEED